MPFDVSPWTININRHKTKCWQLSQHYQANGVTHEVRHFLNEVEVNSTLANFGTLHAEWYAFAFALPPSTVDLEERMPDTSQASRVPAFDRFARHEEFPNGFGQDPDVLNEMQILLDGFPTRSRVSAFLTEISTRMEAFFAADPEWLTAWQNGIWITDHERGGLEHGAKALSVLRQHRLAVTGRQSARLMRKTMKSAHECLDYHLGPIWQNRKHMEHPLAFLSYQLYTLLQSLAPRADGAALDSDLTVSNHESLFHKKPKTRRQWADVYVQAWSVPGGTVIFDDDGGDIVLGGDGDIIEIPYPLPWLETDYLTSLAYLCAEAREVFMRAVWWQWQNGETVMRHQNAVAEMLGEDKPFPQIGTASTLDGSLTRNFPSLGKT